jgi:phospholipid/cholesterol/gamma-HCH transport system substrate-binding protein
MINKRYVAVGLLVIALGVAFTLYVVGGLSGRVSSAFPVSVTFDHTGQLLRVTGDVRLRGVEIGKIQRIDHLRDGRASITLALDQGLRIPADVTASIRGKTLFGEKYVELIDPTKPSGGFLKPGDHIPETRTVQPFELEQVLESLVPVLDAAKPGDLGGALHALATGVVGNEEVAQRTIDNALVVLETLGKSSGDLDRLLGGLDTGTGALADATPDLVASLRDLDTLSKQLIANQSDFRSLLHDTPTWLDVAAQLVEARYRDLVDVAVKGGDILHLVASHRSALPSTVSGLKNFTQDWVTNLSTPCEDAAGTSVGEKHIELAGSTCWQVWILTAEKDKPGGGYDATTRPTPGPGASIAAAAYIAQLRQMLALPFGTEPTPLQRLLYSSIRDANGLIPEVLL